MILMKKMRNEIVILLSSSSEHIVCLLSDSILRIAYISINILTLTFQQCAMVYIVTEHDTKLNQTKIKRKPNQMKPSQARACQMNGRVTTILKSLKI